MDIEILAARNPADARRWGCLWESLPQERRDVYFLPAYVLANEEEGRGEALCFVARRGAALLLHPFLRAPVPGTVELGVKEPISDIQTPYGYGGPVVNEAGEEQAFLDAAWEGFGAWCRQSGVIAEFIRFHPLLQNDRWAGGSTRVLLNRQTIYLDLRTYAESFRAESFFRNHRQMTSRATRRGAATEKVPAEQAISWFASRYAQTLHTLGAGAEARFGQAYFSSLARGLGPRASVWIVRQAGGEMARAILQTESEFFSHGHLMAYGEESSSAGLTNLLLHDIALDAAARGLKVMHVGGGRAPGEDDELFKFKRRLAPGRADFRIGTCCYQPERFQELRRAWEAKHGPPTPGFFLFYRANR